LTSGAIIWAFQEITTSFFDDFHSGALTASTLVLHYEATPKYTNDHFIMIGMNTITGTLVWNGKTLSAGRVMCVGLSPNKGVLAVFGVVGGGHIKI